MKIFKYFNIAALLSMLLMTAACSKDDLVFDHELPQFQTREGAYLLEVIMPQGTTATNDIYICGVFNGGDEEAVLQDARWKLEKAENNDIKWGIYLFPEDFVSGTSLQDGYYFINEQQGVERSLQNQPVVHTEAPALGGRINVWVDRWSSYFDTPVDPGDIEHDGYAIYVDDQTTWGALALYAWGSDLPELFGGWPGAKPTGTITIGATTYKYFDTGAANDGLNYNLIFNNNGDGKQLADFNVTLDKDYYLLITDDGVKEVDADPGITHDGYAIFIINNTGWEETAMYAWASDLPELFGGWPGITPTGTQTINGVEYQYFDTGAANAGLGYNLILNNNNGGKQFDMAYVVLERDYYFVCNASSCEEVDPANPPVVGPVEPEQPTETHPHTIYVQNTLNWSENALYAWGDKEMFGGWPGLLATEQKNVGGATFWVFPYEGAGETLNLILNDNGAGQQIDGPAITADRDYYFQVSADGWLEVSPEPTQYKLYVEDLTGWDAISVYAWGDKEMFGGWPGAQPEATESVDGVEYKVFFYNGEGETLNLIFNNNGEGMQLPDFTIVADKDYYLKVTAEGVTAIE